MAAPRGPGGRFLSREELAEGNTTNSNTTNEDSNTATLTLTKENEKMSATDTGNDARYEVEFVDDLPKISRKVESGVWVERLAPLRDNPGQWARIFGPTNSPHAQVNNLRGGNAAGIDPDDYQFAGRNLPTDETDEDGKPVKAGYVFARFLTDEQKAERDAKREAGEDTDEDE